MFASLPARFGIEIDALKNVVTWQESLRETINAPPGATAPALVIDAPSLEALRSHAPAKLPWQVFDHYAAVSRIYALFERTLCDLAGEYLTILPTITEKYENLHERLRNQHRIGVGHVLTKWSPTNPLYSSLSERDIAAGLSDGLRGTSYALLLDAFLVSPENFRANAIVRLFGDLGFDNAFGFVSKFPSVEEFLRVRLGGAETAESFLDGFVRIRNEAAHGSGSSLVSASEIVNYADFTVLIVNALAALLLSHTLRLGLVAGKCVQIGDVVHLYSNNIIGFRSSSAEVLTIGDKLYGGKKLLESIEITDLQVADVKHPNIVLSAGLELGIKLNRPVAVNSVIVRWKP